MILLGHEEIRARLARAADRDSLHHAYLFEGPQGLGKRAVADWLVRYTNCLSENKPCGTCRRCVQIAAGAHPDILVVEPDASKATATIPVDAVREVVRKAGYHRYDSQRRFVIVDPADAMMDPAANALLKTLEEPPAGTGFILVVASAKSLLPTILSRCQRVRFGAVPTDDIERWLADQGLPQPAQAARMSLGCPGRAHTLATGGLEARRQARSTVTLLTTVTLAEMFTRTAAIVKGKDRGVWRREVELLFDLVEELLRDCAIRGSDSALPLLHEDAAALVGQWTAALMPDGIHNVQQALQDAREQLEVQANGGLVLDAFFARLRRELQA